jgi:glycosyltransferase involved in cell wall biosynthesis
VTRPRVAIAHDYLTQRGGAERVVLALHRAFPEATVHTLLYDAEATFPDFRDIPIVTSPLDRITVLRRHHRLGLPILAAAAGRMVVDADVTVVSTSGWAHGFDIRGRTVVYCHNPARWLYQAGEYVGDARALTLSALGLRVLAPALRRWDRRAAARHDRYLANSTVVRERIEATYGREATVLFPPATVTDPGPQERVGPFAPGFHLLVSRLLPYKNVHKAVEAFAVLPDERLLIIGQGPDEQRLRRSMPANVALVGGVSDSQLRWAYASCSALLAPSIEDFGLTPLEAGAFGKPTVALRRGGYLDTVAEGVSGLFLERPEPALIVDAVRRERATEWDPVAIEKHAQQFGEERFREAIRAEVEQQLRS